MDLNIVNNGKPYFFRFDIAKEAGEIARITDYLKTRVSDNGKKVPIKWFDQGQAMDVHGMSPFIQGGVGHYTKDDNGEMLPSSDVVYREWYGTPADVTDDGVVYYTLEDQFFCKQGEFNGFFGLRDSQGNVLTSVNIVFQILGNDLRITKSKEFYIGELENLKNKFKNDGNQAIADFNAKIEAGTENNRTALNALSASIQANRDGQASIAEQQSSIIRQIKDNDIVTVAKQQSDINEISQAINNRLSKLHNGPVAIENADKLKSKYPQGADGTFLTLDTNHIWVWLNNQWTDAGTYQAAGLSQQAQQAIENTRSIVLGNELIPNGSFGTGKTDPAIPLTEDTHLSVKQWSNRNWLQISSDGNSPFKGVKWNLNNSDKTYFDNPLQLDFDIQSLENRNLEIYVIYYDKSGQALATPLFDKLNLTAGKYIHYQNVIYLDQSQRGCAYVGLQISQKSTDTLWQILITGLSLHEIYNAKVPSSNLLALDNAQPNLPDITSLSTIVTNNKRWVKITTAGGKAWGGASWDIPIVQDMPYNPFKLEFDIHGDDKARTWNISIYGWDNSGAQKVHMNVGDTYVDINQIAHISRNILFPQQIFDCTTASIIITTPDTEPVGYTKISDLSLTLVPKTVNAGNNLINLLYAKISKPEITSLSMTANDNKQWLTITTTGGKAGAGACWDIPIVEDMPYAPFKLEFDLRGDDQARTWNISIYGWDNSGAQKVYMNVGDTYVDINQIAHISRNILFPQQVADCTKAQIMITTADTKPVRYTKISDLSLTLVPKTVNAGNNLINLLYAQKDMPDITSLSISASDNKKWLAIKTTGGKAGAGVWWDIPRVEDLPYVPFKLEFDIRGDEQTRTWNIFITGWDNNSNSQKINMDVGDIYVEPNQTLHISRNISFPQQVAESTSLHIHITTPDTNPISWTRISDLSLKLFPETTNDDPEKYGLPIMCIKGDLTGISHNNPKNITWTFIDAHRTLSGYGTLKSQGNSSLNWPKRPYRLKTLTSDFQQKDKVKFKASWKKESKFNLKAYYTDGLLSRDPVNAEIGGAIASSRRDLPNDLVEEDNFGLIQGFPIILTLNGEFAGLYSLNTARPDFDYTKFAIMGNQSNKLTTFQETNPSVKLDGTDFESLNPEDTPTDEEKQAVNALIKFISTSSDDDFKTKLADHISVNSAIDYLIFSNIIGNRDAFAKNQIYLSWDGTHWHLQAYDLDDTYQGGWDGKVFEAPTDIIGTDNKLFARLNTLFSSQIKNRYQEIRAWLTPDYVLNKYKNRIEEIGIKNYQREYQKWDNPAKDTEDFAQLRKAVYTQFKLLDSKWLS